MLVYNVNFQIMFSFFVKSHVSHWKHLQDIIDIEFKLPCLLLPVWYEVTRFTNEVWAFWSYFLCELVDHVFFFVKSHISHWKHLQDTIDTELKLPCLLLMWTFISYFQFDMKAHVSQLKCEFSDYILFLMWSHQGNTWKILWIQDLNFHNCF